MNSSSRESGTVLLMVLIMMVILAGLCYASVSIAIVEEKALRYYTAKAQCFYAAEAAIAQAKHDILELGGGGDIAQVTFGQNGVVIEVNSETDGPSILLTATAILDRDQAASTVSVWLTEVPMFIPNVAAVYIDSNGVLDLNGIIGIDGDGLNGISTNGDAIDLLTQIPSNIQDSIFGSGGSPSVGTVEALDIEELCNNFRTMCSEQTDPNDFGSSGNPVSLYFNSDIDIAGSGAGFGMLVIEGNLSISGTFDYEGLIIVNGDVDISGTAFIGGSILTNGVLTISGTADIGYGETVLNNLQQDFDDNPRYEQVAWTK